MRRIKLLTPFLLALGFAGLQASAQTTSTSSGNTSACPGAPVEESFNYGDGGFTSPDFTYTSLYGRWQANFSTAQIAVTKTITSPQYILSQSANLRVGFTLQKNNTNVNLISVSLSLYRGNGTLVATATNATPVDPTSFSSIFYCFNFNGYAAIQPGQSYYMVSSVTANADATSELYFDNFSFLASAGGALPVDFKTVSVKSSGSSNQVNWSVGDEIDVDHYELQRSADARVFSSVASVKASGLESYSATDSKLTSGAAYYRIKSVDIDGKYKYSYVVSTDKDSKLAMRAFPSPASTELILTHSSASAGSKIFIDGINGQSVKTVAPGKGSVQTRVDVSSLTPGIYMVRFVNANGAIETLKFVKQ